MIMQKYNYAKLPANLYIDEEWLRGFTRVEPPVPLQYANWTPEKFSEMIVYAGIHLPSNNYVSQQGAECYQTDQIHIHTQQ